MSYVLSFLDMTERNPEGINGPKWTIGEGTGHINARLVDALKELQALSHRRRLLALRVHSVNGHLPVCVHLLIHSLNFIRPGLKDILPNAQQ